MSVDSDEFTHVVDGDTIVVYEWTDDPIPEIEAFVEQMNGSEVVGTDQRKKVTVGEDWFEYELDTHTWHNGEQTRHTISYQNVPDDMRSEMSGALEQALHTVGASITQVDFENQRFILSDQSLIESRFPDGNNYTND